MKKILLVISLILMSIYTLATQAENSFTEIECTMNTQTKYAYNNRIIDESVYVQKFKIDDINKQLYIYSTGQQAPISGYSTVFNSDEIVIQNAKASAKDDLSLKIDRRSGSIFMKNTKADRWWGDIVTVYQGTCSKLDTAKF